MGKAPSCHSMYFQKEASLLLHDVLCSKCKILDQNYRPEYIFFRKSYNLRRIKSIPNFQTRKSTRILAKLESFYHTTTKELLSRSVNETKSCRIKKLHKTTKKKKNFSALNSPTVIVSEQYDVSMYYSKDLFLSLFNLDPYEKSLAEKNLRSVESYDTFIPDKKNVYSPSADTDQNLEILANFDLSSIMCRDYLNNCQHISNDDNELDVYCKWNLVEKRSPVSWPCTFIKLHSHTQWSHSYKFKKIEILKFLKNLQSRKPLNQLDLTKTPVLQLNRVLQDISFNISFVCLNDLISKTLSSQVKLKCQSEADNVLCITPPITPVSD